MKQIKGLGQEDAARSLLAVTNDIEMMRKQVNDMEVRKAEKRELLDVKQKTQLSLDQKIDKSEVHAVISDFTQDQS